MTRCRTREPTRPRAFFKRRAGGWGAWRLALSCARVVVAALVIVGAPGLIAGIGKTHASFSDAELSAGNTLRAASLDLKLQTNGTLTGWVGAQWGGEVVAGILIRLETSANHQPSVTLRWEQDIALSDPEACAAVALNASHNGAPPVAQSLGDSSATLSADAQGAWQLIADVPVGALPLAVAHGQRCVGTLRAVARDGFSDEEAFPLDVRIPTILLNEILPHPDPDAPSPNDREWIELINIGDEPVNVAGWAISELTSSGSEVFHPIRAIGELASPSDLVPVLGSTLIPPGGTLVLAFAGAQSYLNNAGDTVRLYEGTSLVDAVAYTQEDAPQGKSIARFPDGIGGWWEPVPTPGLPNQPSPDDVPLVARKVVVPPREDPVDVAPPPSAVFPEAATSSSTLVRKSGDPPIDAEKAVPVVLPASSSTSVLPLLPQKAPEDSPFATSSPPFLDEEQSDLLQATSSPPVNAPKEDVSASATPRSVRTPLHPVEAATEAASNPQVLNDPLRDGAPREPHPDPPSLAPAAPPQAQSNQPPLLPGASRASADEAASRNARTAPGDEPPALEGVDPSTGKASEPGDESL